jgi:hypothetical protein
MRRNLGEHKLDDDAGGLRDTVQCSAAPKAVKAAGKSDPPKSY